MVHFVDLIPKFDEQSKDLEDKQYTKVNNTKYSHLLCTTCPKVLFIEYSECSKSRVVTISNSYVASGFTNAVVVPTDQNPEWQS